MIVVLGMHRGGGSELVGVLRSLGCDVRDLPEPRFLHPALREIDDEILRRAAGDFRFADPDLLAALLPELERSLGTSARSAVARASERTVLHDPRLCLTLPFWQRIFGDATYLLVHRNPVDLADDLLREDGVPPSAGFAMWQLYMTSAAHYTRAARRCLVPCEDLERDPSAIEAYLRAFLDHAAPATLPVRAPGRRSSTMTLAQHELCAELERGRFPEPSVDPFARLARDPLILLQRATRRRPDAENELAEELGRTRARAWHLELRERDAGARLRELSIERARTRSQIDELSELLAAERTRAAAQATDLSRLAYEHGELVRDLRSRRSPGDRRKLHDIDIVLRHFKKRLYDPWTAQEGVPYCGISGKKKLRVMIGTLYGGENELERSRASVREQSYPAEHRISESRAAHWEAFHSSDCDLLVELDADTVLTAPDFIERIVDAFRASPELEMLSADILDFFSAAPIRAIHAYRRSVQHGVPSSKRLVVTATFVRDAIQAPDPSPLQAFRFGARCAHEVREARHDPSLGPLSPAGGDAEEHLARLEKTWRHFSIRRDVRLALACLGFELGLLGRSELAHSDSHRDAFREYERLSVSEVESTVLELRAARAQADDVQALRDRRGAITAARDAPIRSILALVPHTQVYGGINRFFELAREMHRLGVRFTLAQPDRRAWDRAPKRHEHPDVEVRFYSEVIEHEWDVVLCGDAFSGTMLTMPFFRAKLAAIYLLNGWGKNPINLVQIALLAPDVVIANSGYSAAQYKGLAPAIVPGGVDLETFRPPPARRPRRNDVFRVCAYPGRRKPTKRFEDTVAACDALMRRGIPIELHAFDQGALHVDVEFPLVFHGALPKNRVRELLWDMDAMVCAEEDGGWSNPAAEAMACGTPLVCTDVGSIDFAVHEETALVVSARDANAITDAAERLYHEPELAERLRTAGLARITRFGWPSVARGLLDVLSAARLDRDGRALQDARARKRLAELGALSR